MRFFVLVGLLLFGCKPAERACEVTFEAAPRVSAPVGAAIDFILRIRNGAARPVRVADLELTHAAFTLNNDQRNFDVPAGSCAEPADVGLRLRFSPTAFGTVTGQLTGKLDGQAVQVMLEGFGTDPRLNTPEVINFGSVALGRAESRPLALRNVGTIGTTLDAQVVSIAAANAVSSADELCVGRLEGGACVSAHQLAVQRETSIPVVLQTRSAGEKAWDVVLSAGDQRLTTRVLAAVVDTRDCRLSALPERLDFGLVVAPEVGRRRLTVRSTGSGPCVVQRITTDDGQFQVRLAPSRTVVLPVGAELQLELEASLRAPPGATGELRIDSLTVPLRAMPPTGCLALSPPVLDFGSTPIDCSTMARRVTLTNICSSPIFFGSARTFPPFVLSATSTPKVLQSSESVAVEVRLHVTGSIGAVSSGLVIDLGNGETSIVSLTGRSERPALRSETFAQDRRTLVDWLMVLDDSPDFTRQHARVRTELDRFATQSESARFALDLRIGFTTTDVSQAGPQGRLRTTDAGLRWAEGDESTFRTTFRELSELSSAGADHQSCLEAAVRALTPPLSIDTATNGGFRREGAWLAVLCVTDDVERSADPARWRLALESLDAGSRLSYSVIGPIGSTCPIDTLDMNGSHAQNTTPFSGGLDDICRPWSLYGVTGGPLGSPRTTFFLGGTPRAGTINVALGGVGLPERTPLGLENWRYDAATNAIIVSPGLFGLDPPDLTVTYQTACF